MTGILEASAGKKALDWIKKYAEQVLQYGKRVATLEERVTALEATLSKKTPDGCPFCGELAMRKTEDGRLLGPPPHQWKTDVWTCKACNQTERRVVHY
jgi:hypothetical protein